MTVAVKKIAENAKERTESAEALSVPWIGEIIVFIDSAIQIRDNRTCPDHNSRKGAVAHNAVVQQLVVQRWAVQRSVVQRLVAQQLKVQ